MTGVLWMLVVVCDRTTAPQTDGSGICLRSFSLAEQMRLTPSCRCSQTQRKDIPGFFFHFNLAFAGIRTRPTVLLHTF